MGGAGLTGGGLGAVAVTVFHAELAGFTLLSAEDGGGFQITTPTPRSDNTLPWRPLILSLIHI